MADDQRPYTVTQTEEEITEFSFKNLLIRLLCLIALGYGLKVLLGRGQMLFAAVVAICIAGFAFSLVMYLVRVFQGMKKK